MAAGLNNQNVNCVLAGGSNIFAATQAGVYRSSDGGSSWINPISGSANFTVSTLAYSSGNVFAGNDNGLFVSADNGISWNPINGVPQTAIFFIRVIGNAIYAGHKNLGIQTILKSVDNGLTWSPFGQAVSSNYSALLDLGSAGSITYAAAADGFYRSADNGSTWSLLSYPNEYIVRVITSGSLICAVGGFGGSSFYFSKDNGSSFSSLGTPGGATNLMYQAEANTSYVYLGSVHGLYRWPLQ